MFWFAFYTSIASQIASNLNFDSIDAQKINLIASNCYDDLKRWIIAPQIWVTATWLNAFYYEKKQTTKTNSGVNNTTKILLLFQLCKEITAKDVENVLSISSSIAKRRLNEMITQGTIGKIGKKRNGRIGWAKNSVSNNGDWSKYFFSVAGGYPLALPGLGNFSL